jgi:hypothetical protein
VKGVNLAWTQPYRDDRFFLDGSGTIAQPIPNGLATVTGTLSGEWFDNTFYAAFRSGAFASLVVTFAGPTAIASTFFPTIKFTMSAIQIRGNSPQVGGPDLLDVDIPFVAKDDGTNPPLKIEYTEVEPAVRGRGALGRHDPSEGHTDHLPRPAVHRRRDGPQSR